MRIKGFGFNHSHFNSVLSFDTGGGHIYLLSPILVTLHSAGPLSPMCIPRAEQSLSSYVFGCSMVLKLYWALERGEHSTKAVCPLCHLADRQAMVPGSTVSVASLLLLLSYQTPPTPPQQHLHPYLQPPAPCHIRLPESPLLPSLIVTQLGMGDQAGWAEARAWIMETLSPTKRDQQSV